MYSKTALELYPELLQHAQASVSAGLEKDAGLRDVLRGGTHFWNKPISQLFSSGARAAAKTVSPAAATASRAAAMGENSILRAGRTGVSAADRSLAAQHLLANRAQDPKRLAMLMDKGYEGGMKNFKALSPDHQAKVNAELQKRYVARGGKPLSAPGGASGAPGASGPGMGLGTKALIGGGLAATGAGAYGIGTHLQANRDKTQRNLAFGAGAATGLAAPHIIKRVGSNLSQLALNPYGGGY